MSRSLNSRTGTHHYPAYPHLITRDTFRREVSNLPGIGFKVHAKIKEYLEDGEIAETGSFALDLLVLRLTYVLESILQSERYQCLSLFTSVYGIGPSTARQLYELGLRTIEDLERYYDVQPGIDATALDDAELQLFTPNGQPIPQRNVKKDGEIPPISIKVALALRKDMGVPIPRSEVEEMHQVIMAELDEIQAGCTSTIAGGSVGLDFQFHQSQYLSSQ